MTTSIVEALAFEPPDRQKAAQSNRLSKKYFAPEFSGLDNIDRGRPTLFVGNHTRYGALDVPLLVQRIYLETGVFPRSLADRLHYKIPVWKHALGKNGAVLGSREMCREMMQAGESIMVFPGGAREVIKGRGTNYKLLWQDRLGFVRMAMENGYTITPFSSLGADEALDVVFDGDDLMSSPVGKLIRYFGWDKYTRGGEFLFPLGRGIGLSVIPRPEKFYFSFGKPIDLAPYKGRQEDRALLSRLQRKVADRVNELIKDSMLYRAQARDDQSPLRRLMQRT